MLLCPFSAHSVFTNGLTTKGRGFLARIKAPVVEGESEELAVRVFKLVAWADSGSYPCVPGAQGDFSAGKKGVQD